MHKQTYLYKITDYDSDTIYNILSDEIFEAVLPGLTVVLKPNWVKESHLYRLDDWDYVITHPTVITAVLRKVAQKMQGNGKIIITDAPQTDSSFKKIIAKYPTDLWQHIAADNQVELQILDLREDEWINEDDLMVSRIKLPGDPKGSTEVNLLDFSEFVSHNKSKRGYYGADYDLAETNKAHDGYNNLYRVSKSVIECDVFINLPKLKTHKKGGITCCLKNLVGINTYKNYLPHHNEGGPTDGGDQFPKENINSKFEGPVVAFLKQHLLQNTYISKLFKPIKRLGIKALGDTNEIVRSGNWYGNDTVWRMILDLNKILFYANPDGTMRAPEWTNAKHYIGIVDGIIAGEGKGPMAPDPIKLNYLICGYNPSTIDAVCARLMGFDPKKIPSINKSFQIKKYPIVDCALNDIVVKYNNQDFELQNLPQELTNACEPHFGWKNHVEY